MWNQSSASLTDPESTGRTLMRWRTTECWTSSHTGQSESPLPPLSLPPSLPLPILHLHLPIFPPQPLPCPSPPLPCLFPSPSPLLILHPHLPLYLYANSHSAPVAQTVFQSTTCDLFSLEWTLLLCPWAHQTSFPSSRQRRTETPPPWSPGYQVRLQYCAPHSCQGNWKTTILGDPGADRGADGQLGREEKRQRRGRGQGERVGKVSPLTPVFRSPHVLPLGLRGWETTGGFTWQSRSFRALPWTRTTSNSGWKSWVPMLYSAVFRYDLTKLGKTVGAKCCC